MKFKYFLLTIFLLFLVGCINSSANITTKNSSGSLESIEVNKKEYVVLLNGVTINKNDQDINIEKANNDVVQKLKAKYEVYYYAFRQGEFLGQFKGKIQPRGLDYYWEVAFDEEFPEPTIFISDKINVYPRPITYNNLLKNNIQHYTTVVNSIEKQFNVKTIPREVIEVDLDNCGDNEYIVCTCSADDYPFYVCLANSKGDIVSYIVAMKNNASVQSYIKNNKELLDLNFSIKKSILVIDIDNDGIIEIVTELPTYESFAFSVSKYNKGEFHGNYINECTIIP